MNKENIDYQDMDEDDEEIIPTGLYFLLAMIFFDNS